ncbi:MAG: hypothetical protein LBR69_02315 [Endomicrobium sp.]|jgi:hypothetical protein|nr:hypothetical protein [Endomicrobium sp.]
MKPIIKFLICCIFGFGLFLFGIYVGTQLQEQNQVLPLWEDVKQEGSEFIIRGKVIQAVPGGKAALFQKNDANTTIIYIIKTGEGLLYDDLNIDTKGRLVGTYTYTTTQNVQKTVPKVYIQ